MRVLALLGVLGIVAMVLTGCGGGSLISQSQEIEMGREAADEFQRENGGLDRDAAINALAQQLATRVTRVAQPPDYPYDVRVLANKQVNAVAFPGGRLYLYRGLVDALSRDPDKLAWVLAHEAAHVSRRHAVKRIEKQLGYEAIISLVLRRGDAPQIARAVAGLMMLSYSRDEELESDRYGLLYSHAAGYDPTAAIAVLRKFQELQGREPSDFEIMFATHPGDDTRINGVQAYLDTQGWSGDYYEAGGG